MDEFTGGVLQNDPDMPYAKNPGPRRIMYGPYVKFVLFPEVCAILYNNIYYTFLTFFFAYGFFPLHDLVIRKLSKHTFRHP